MFNKILTACALIVFVSLAVTAITIAVKAMRYSTDNAELIAENKRLQYFEDVINEYDITISYNGCEDVIERLGLNKEVGNEED